MTNNVIIAVIVPFSVMTSIMIIIAGLYGWDKQINRIFLFLSIAVLGWQLSEIFYFMSNDFVWSARFFNLKLVFTAPAAVFLLLLCIRFYRLERYISTRFLLALFIIPCFTMVFSLTSEYHQLIRHTLLILETQPLHQTLNIRGVWFWIHSAYSYMLLLACVSIIISEHRKLPTGYKVSSIIFLLGICATILSNVLIIFDIINNPFDITIVGMSLAQIFLYVAIADSDRVDYLVLARNDVLNFLEEYVFILDNERRVLDCNHAAKKWVESFGLSGDRIFNFSEIFNHLKKVSIIPEKNNSTDQALSIYVSEANLSLVYNLNEKTVLDTRGHQLGVFVIFNDVTKYKTHMDQLEEAAGIDPLTGLANRRGFEQLKLELDIPASYPLSIVLGDVNNMKYINDNMGHAHGDLLLRAVAKTLEEICADKGIAARIGGDEFIVLLPNTSMIQAKNMFASINEASFWQDHFKMRSSLALGFSEKSSADTSLDALIHKADLDMYSNKESDRRGKAPFN